MLDKALLAVLPHVPRPLLWPVAKRYVAGTQLSDALAVLRELAARGHPGIIDILGEDVTSPAEARAVMREYAEASDAVARAGLDAYVSVKPTHVGLRLSEELALELYRELARHSAGNRQSLRVEMEDRTTTDATLRVFEALRAEHDNTGIVLQSRLLRTPADAERLMRTNPRGLWVRLVKGIYLEPAEVAHTEPDPIRAAYLALARALLERGARVSFATHDAGLARGLLAVVRELGVPRERYEFQVLLGVQQQLWSEWRAAGHAVRVYVPFGPEWQPYSLRRLRKNPEILRHVVRATLGLG
jgi:proline dehydrogenase